MPSERINPAELGPPSGFSHAVSVTADRMVFLAGQLGAGPDGTIVPGGIAAQFEQALANVLTALTAAGRSLFGASRRGWMHNLWIVGQDSLSRQEPGSFTICDAPSQRLHNNRSAHSALANQHHAPLVAAAQDLNRCIQFLLAPRDGFEHFVRRQLRQVAKELVCLSGLWGSHGSRVVRRVRKFVAN